MYNFCVKFMYGFNQINIFRLEKSMFSGLVREFARVRFYKGNVLCLESALHPNLGDSIAVNGACLTAISSEETSFCVELSENTAKIIAVENLKGMVHKIGRAHV